MLPGSVGYQVSGLEISDGVKQLEVEHPTGFFTVEMEITGSEDMARFRVERAALLRTARLLMRGEVMVPETLV
jgi:4-oxalomesaconate tautomerase